MTWLVEYTEDAERDLSDIYEYAILYFPNKANSSVSIIRIIYGGRDISVQLVPQI